MQARRRAGSAQESTSCSLPRTSTSSGTDNLAGYGVHVGRCLTLRQDSRGIDARAEGRWKAFLKQSRVIDEGALMTGKRFIQRARRSKITFAQNVESGRRRFKVQHIGPGLNQ